MKKEIITVCIICIFLVNYAKSQPAFKIKAFNISNIDESKKGQVFKTPDLIDYNYLSLEEKSKKKLLSDLYDELHRNSLGQDKTGKVVVDKYGNSLLDSQGAPLYMKFTTEVINEKKQEIARLEKEIANINVKKSPLYQQYVNEYITSRKANVLNFGSKRSLAFFNIVYSGDTSRFSTLNNSGFNIGDETGSVYSELVSGNLGIFRASLGTMVSKSSSTNQAEAKNEEAYQRLSTYVEIPVKLTTLNRSKLTT